MCRAGPRSLAAARATAKQLHARGIESDEMLENAQSAVKLAKANISAAAASGWRSSAPP